MKICFNRNIEFFSLSFVPRSSLHQFNCISLQIFLVATAGVVVQTRLVRTKKNEREIEREKLAVARWQFILSIFLLPLWLYHLL